MSKRLAVTRHLSLATHHCLLVSKRHHRVHAHRSARRHIASKQGDGEQQARHCRERNGISCADAKKQLFSNCVNISAANAPITVPAPASRKPRASTSRSTLPGSRPAPYGCRSRESVARRCTPAHRKFRWPPAAAPRLRTGSAASCEILAGRRAADDFCHRSHFSDRQCGINRANLFAQRAARGAGIAMCTHRNIRGPERILHERHINLRRLPCG